jgi:glycosyltransferase involved in cell wall biosynthesis
VEKENPISFSYYSGIKYISYLDNTGYAIAAQMLLSALCGAGLNLTWVPLTKVNSRYAPVNTECIESGNKLLDELYRKDIEYDIVIIHAVPVDYGVFLNEEKSLDKKVYGHTVWETDKLPKSWVSILNQLDGVIVPSGWNLQTFIKSGVTVPVVTLPHLSQYEGQLPLTRSNFLQGIDPATFVFYTIAEWSERKIIHEQIRTYMRTFQKTDNVCLIVKTSKTNFTSLRRSRHSWFRKRHQPLMPLIKQLYRKYRNSAGLLFITDSLSENEMKQLHARGNCYLSLCRSEGWGLGAYEAAWFGKPVIMTAFGGQLEFLPAEFSYLVGYKLVSIVPKEGWLEYEADQQWAEPDQVQASGLMKEVFAHPRESSEKGLELQKYVRDKFAVKRIVDHFNSIFLKGNHEI